MRRWSLVASVLSVALVLVFGGTASAGSSARKDPYLAFCFRVTIEAQGETSAEGFFRSISGLESETEVTEYREGGANEGSHKLVGATKWKNIVLKRGFAGFSPNDPFQKWARQVAAGQDVRKDMTITLRDADDNEIAKLQYLRCVPVRWGFGAFLSPRDPASSPRDPASQRTPEHDAMPSEISVETIEIAHEGLMKVP